MINTVININKEKNWTSHDVVAKIRKIVGQKKVGHTGTLDPLATGVLPICLGRCTKLSDIITGEQKEYEVEFILGISTDTEDITGKVLNRCEVLLTDNQIRQAIYKFIGKIKQVPPMYSAIKVEGKKLYEIAREGKSIERKSREVEIFSIKNININGKIIKMRVVCSKGTYIRSLCRDIGEELKVKATMLELKRIKVGKFDIGESITIGEFEKKFKLKDIKLDNIDEILSEYDRLYCISGVNKLLYNGNAVDVRHIEKIFERETQISTDFDEYVKQNDGKEYRVYSSKGDFIGIFKIKDRNIYPKIMFWVGDK